MSITTEIVPALFKFIDDMLTREVAHLYSFIQHYLQKPFVLLTTLYFVGLGIAISQGWITINYSEFIKRFVKLGLILTFAFHWDIFHDIVINLFQTGIYDLVSQLTQTTTHSNNRLYFANGLQTFLNQFSELGLSAWIRGSLGHYSPYFTAMMIWSFGYGLVLTALFYLLIAKILLSLLFALAPLFIILALTPLTFTLFSRWIGQVSAYAFVTLFISIALAMIMDLAVYLLSGFQHKGAAMELLGFIPVMILSVISIGVLKQTNQLAHKIGAGIADFSQSIYEGGHHV